MSDQHELPGNLAVPAALPAPAAGAGARAAWARILPFATYMAFIVIADLLGRMGFNAQDLRWLYAVKIGAVMLMLALFWRDYTELKNAPLRMPAAAVAVVTGIVVLVLWINLTADWMIVGSADGFNPTTDGRLDWRMIAVRIFGAALVVPVMEELFWRSFLMRWVASGDFLQVDPARVGLKGFIVGITLFGFEHNLWLAGIVAGAAYSALYVRYRTLWSAILAHAFTNGLLGIWIVYTRNWTFW
jgi:CAAX prenyl protease-like protein